MNPRPPALLLLLAASAAAQVSPPPAAPVAADDFYRFPSRAPYSRDAAHGVLANDSGPGPLSAELVAAPAHGTLKLNPDGSFAYTPTGVYHGVDAFTYRAGAGGVASNVGFVKFHVVAAPVAADDRYPYVVPAGVAVGPAKGVLANDLDVNGPLEPRSPLLPMLASLATPPAHGTLILYPDGAFSYVPRAGYSGPDRFTYKTTNTVAEATATVDLYVASP